MINRAIAVLVLAAVVSVFGWSQAFAEEAYDGHRPRGHFGIGAGFGARYGVAGLGIEVSPAEYLSFTGGAGFFGALGGYSVGVRLFPTGRSWRVRPWLSLCAGDIIGITPYGVGESAFVSYGVGGEIGLSSKHTLDFGVEVYQGDDSVVLPTVGWKYHF